VTKLTLFLLVLPMTWRMVQKARIMYKKESAARRKAAADKAAATAAALGDESPTTAAVLEVVQAEAPLGSAAAVSSSGGDLAPLQSEVSAVADLPAYISPAVSRGQLELASGGAAATGHGAEQQQQQQPMRRTSSNPLGRLSVTLSAMSRSTIGDTFGPDLGALGSPTKVVTAAAGVSGDVDEAAAAAAAIAAASTGADSAAAAAAVSRFKGDIEEALSSSREQTPAEAAAAGGGCSIAPTAAAAAAAAATKSCKRSWRLCMQSNLPQAPLPSIERCNSIRARITREESSQLPILQVALLVAILAAVAVSNLTAGFLLTCGTWQWWLLMLSPLPFMVLVWAVVRCHVLWKQAWKKVLSLKEVGDLKWDERSTVVFPAMCITAGIIAGMLGLGGKRSSADSRGHVVAPQLLL
jgi:hypothetical protein